MSTDLYAILDVPRDATLEQIRKAYKHLAMLKHPDRGGDAAEFAEIQKVHAVLKDEERRATYDATGNTKLNAEYEEMLQELAGLFFRAVSELPEGHDYFGAMYGAVEGSIDLALEAAEKDREIISKHTRIMQRLRRKAEGENVFVEMLNADIGIRKQRMADVPRRIERVKKMMKILEEYEVEGASSALANFIRGD